MRQAAVLAHATTTSNTGAAAIVTVRNLHHRNKLTVPCFEALTQVKRGWVSPTRALREELVVH